MDSVLVILLVVLLVVLLLAIWLIGSWIITCGILGIIRTVIKHMFIN